MDHHQLQRAAQSRKALSYLKGAIAHLSSDSFIELPLEDRIAHAEGYRSMLPELNQKLPNHPHLRADLHLLTTYLQIYE